MNHARSPSHDVICSDALEDLLKAICEPPTEWSRIKNRVLRGFQGAGADTDAETDADTRACAFIGLLLERLWPHPAIRMFLDFQQGARHRAAGADRIIQVYALLCEQAFEPTHAVRLICEAPALLSWDNTDICALDAECYQDSLAELIQRVRYNRFPGGKKRPISGSSMERVAPLPDRAVQRFEQAQYIITTEDAFLKAGWDPNEVRPHLKAFPEVARIISPPNLFLSLAQLWDVLEMRGAKWTHCLQQMVRRMNKASRQVWGKPPDARWGYELALSVHQLSLFPIEDISDPLDGADALRRAVIRASVCEQERSRQREEITTGVIARFRQFPEWLAHGCLPVRLLTTLQEWGLAPGVIQQNLKYSAATVLLLEPGEKWRHAVNAHRRLHQEYCPFSTGTASSKGVAAFDPLLDWRRFTVPLETVERRWHQILELDQHVIRGTTAEAVALMLYLPDDVAFRKALLDLTLGDDVDDLDALLTRAEAEDDVDD